MIGPNYQAGHSHADTFNFELVVKNKPIVVDRGTSTYENNDTYFRRELNHIIQLM